MVSLTNRLPVIASCDEYVSKPAYLRESLDQVLHRGGGRQSLEHFSFGAYLPWRRPPFFLPQQNDGWQWRSHILDTHLAYYRVGTQTTPDEKRGVRHKNQNGGRIVSDPHISPSLNRSAGARSRNATSSAVSPAVPVPTTPRHVTAPASL
jgi:hypothetical protein